MPRFQRQLLVVAILTSALQFVSGTLSAQTSAADPPAGTPSTAPTPSQILAPALASLKPALEGLQPEKWKAPANLTHEVTVNLASIHRDLDTNLPPLLATADANPNSLPQLLPAYRNIDALYDVLIRVSEVSILGAPTQQSVNLQQATIALEASRRTLGDRLQSTAESKDQQFTVLETKLHTLESTPPPPAPVCPTVAPAAKPAPKKKPVPKPVTPPATPPATP